jgi:hypothetical protein
MAAGAVAICITVDQGDVWSCSDMKRQQATQVPTQLPATDAEGRPSSIVATSVLFQSGTQQPRVKASPGRAGVENSVQSSWSQETFPISGQTTPVRHRRVPSPKDLSPEACIERLRSSRGLSPGAPGKPAAFARGVPLLEKSSPYDCFLRSGMSRDPEPEIEFCTLFSAPALPGPPVPNCIGSRRGGPDCYSSCAKSAHIQCRSMQLIGALRRPCY